MLFKLLERWQKAVKERRYRKLLKELKETQMRVHTEKRLKRAHEKAKQDIENWPHV